MADDDKRKECKHCMTMISRRASVCPQCRSTVSAFAGVVGFFRTGAWLVTATVSLGFAGLEKIDNLGLGKELADAGIKLNSKNITIAAKEIQADVLREAITKIAARPQGAMMAAAPEYRVETGNAEPGAPLAYRVETPAPAAAYDPSEQIAKIDADIAELFKATPIDRRRIKDLEREKLQLEFGFVP